MATETTLTSAKAWSPDTIAYLPTSELSTALLLQVGNIVGQIEGDEPAVRVPFVADDGTAGFVAEGVEIPHGPGTLDEVVVHTRKIATLATFSREQLSIASTAQDVLTSMQRSVVAAADRAFLSNLTDPTGLLNVAGITDGGVVGDSLDTLADAITTIEADGGAATHIIAAPDAWGSLAKLKTGTGSNAALLGAGVEAAERRLLSVPVLTSSAVPAGQLLVVDGTQIVGAAGQVQVARSDEALFSSDSTLLRVTFRCGWAVMRPARIVKLTTVEA